MTVPRSVTEHDDAALVFAAYNCHTPSCGRPPRVCNLDTPALYHGYLENGFGEQFVFTFDRTTATGTVSGGDLGWHEPQTFTEAELREHLRETQALVAKVAKVEGTAPPELLGIDIAGSLGRLAGLTGRDEVAWLRACLVACALDLEGNGSSGSG